jgi:hypothetical protein
LNTKYDFAATLITQNTTIYAKFTLSAVAPLITTTSLLGGTVGTAYNQTLAATGTAPITWTVETGSLPGGLTLAEETGVISGTPTTAGKSDFTVKAANAVNSDTKALSITVRATVEAVFEYYWEDEYGVLVTTLDDADTTINAGDSITIAAEGTGYNVIQWYLNSNDTGETGTAYTFSSMAAGTHTIGLLVEKGGEYYNTNITITVQ